MANLSVNCHIKKDSRVRMNVFYNNSSKRYEASLNIGKDLYLFARPEQWKEIASHILAKVQEHDEKEMRNENE